MNDNRTILFVAGHALRTMRVMSGKEVCNACKRNISSVFPETTFKRSTAQHESAITHKITMNKAMN